MRSRDERRADFERREAVRKAKFAERMGKIRERSAELDAEAAERRQARDKQQRLRDDAILEQAGRRTGDGMPIAEGPGALFVNIAEARNNARLLGAMWRKRKRNQGE